MSKTIRVSRSLRSKLRELADERDMTYDELISEILPDPSERTVLERDEVQMDVSDETHEQLAELAGERVSMREVVQHYLTEADLEKNDA